MSARQPRPDTPSSVRLARLLAGLTVASLLTAAVLGGLLRAGVAVPFPSGAAWPGHAVTSHAFLMMFAFMGTVIGAERAVAVKHPAAFAAPVCSALAGLCMLAGWPGGAKALAMASAVVFGIVNARLVIRQPAAHTRLLLVSAFALFVANLLYGLGSPVSVVVPWWFAFLVLTIAAERLEMTRLMRRRPGATVALCTALAALLAGAAAFAASPALGAAIYGAALVALAAWLFSFDIATKTVTAPGLSRYMAVCLLLGYAWLAVAGVAWVAAGFGQPTRDVALHALGLGFVFSMMLGHAPVILPALVRIKVAFGWAYYLPLALLHGSLVLRLASRLGVIELLGMAAGAHAIAIVLFIATMAGGALAWRRAHPAR